MKQIGYFLFLLMGAFPSTVSTSHFNSSYLLPRLVHQPKKETIPFWDAFCCFMTSRFILWCKENLSVSSWRYPTLFFWSHCWAVNAVKVFFSFPLQTAKNYFITAGVLYFFSEFFSISSYSIVSKLWFVFVACVLIEKELWTRNLGRFIDGRYTCLLR